MNTVTFTPALPNENLYLVVGRFDGEENITQVYSALTEDLATAALIKHISYVNDTEEDNENIIIDQCMLLSDLVVQPSCSHKELLEKLPPVAIYAEIDDANRVVFDGVCIEFNVFDNKNNVFDNELVNYRLENREELMDNLISWIAVARYDPHRSSDFLLMKQDLFMLSELDDDYVWSSTEEPEFISPSKNPEKFNEICVKIIEANRMAELNSPES